jgi:branched-chain amino acid aminotransferase
MFEYVYINGRFYPKKRAKISVNDRGFLYGDGIFETMLCHGGRIFMFSLHMDRLFHSLRALKFNDFIDGKGIEKAVYKTLSKNKLSGKDAYIKIIITRGEHGGKLNFNTDRHHSLIIIVKRLKPYPPEIYSDGVDIISSSVLRRPYGEQVYRHKLLSYFENIYEKDRANSRGAFESLFLTGDKLVLEGSTSNIFIGGRSALYTPSASLNILPGITRKAVLGLCRANGIRSWEKKLHYRDLINAREVFLTSSIAGIVPVKKVDAHQLYSPVPGPLTSKISELYQNKLTE